MDMLRFKRTYNKGLVKGYESSIEMNMLQRL